MAKPYESGRRIVRSQAFTVSSTYHFPSGNTKGDDLGDLILCSDVTISELLVQNVGGLIFILSTCERSLALITYPILAY